MRAAILRLGGLFLVALTLLGHRAAAQGPAWLGAPTPVAAGVDLFRVDGRLAFAGEEAPRSLRLLRLDPRRVRLSASLATGEVPGRATVLHIARRGGAIAAVNAGFFSPTGDPNGLLKIDGRLLSDTRRSRGAVALANGTTGVVTLFDRVSARVQLRFRAGGGWRVAWIDGVDTVRGAGRLMLYTPASGATTDTAGGLEWQLRGAPLRASAPSRAGNSAIPADGLVLSFGGTSRPRALAGLTAATTVQVREALTVSSGQRLQAWRRAPTLVGGAGLLIRNGQAERDWATERLSEGFATTLHPRTVIARDRRGSLWLITVDGRQPERAVGMSFADLHALLARLDIVDALNLDGGGSTTMVVGGRVENHPSDVLGPRPVSDALLVHAR